MRRHLATGLMALCAVLALVLLAMWVGRSGLRNVKWTPPAAIRPDFSAAPSALATPGAADAGLMAATLERPLFSPTRRPPPAVAVAAAAAPPDPLANIKLFGVYNGPGGGGIIAQVDGKMRRASLNDKIGEWTVKKIADRDVTFVNGGTSRVVSLARVQPQGLTAPARPRRAAASGTPPITSR